MQDDEQGGVSLLSRKTPVDTESVLKLHFVSSSAERSPAVLTRAQDRGWQGFQHNQPIAHDLQASPQSMSAPIDVPSHTYSFYENRSVPDPLISAQMQARLPSHIVALGQIPGPEQYAHLNVQHPSSLKSLNLNRAGPFDKRWVENPEEMWNRGTTRTSPLTISPGESGSDSDANDASSGSSLDHSSIPNAIKYSSSAIANAIPSEGLASWLEAIRPNVEAQTSSDLQHTSLTELSEGPELETDRSQTARIGQHQAKMDPGEDLHVTSSRVTYQSDEDTEHSSEHTLHVQTDNVGSSMEGNLDVFSSMSYQTSFGAATDLTKEDTDCSRDHTNGIMSYGQRQQSSTVPSATFMDKLTKIMNAKHKEKMDAAIARGVLTEHHQQYDQTEPSPGSRGDTSWICSLVENAKRRRTRSVARKAINETRLRKQAAGDLFANASSQSLPSVVVTPNKDSPQSQGQLVLFAGTSANAQHTAAFLSQHENQSQRNSHPDAENIAGRTNTFSSQLSAAMNLASIEELQDRVETLRVLRTHLSMDITLADTYGQQQRSYRLRPTPGEQIYYEMKDVNGKPYLFPWPPKEGSAAYAASHKPDQLLHLEAHPKGFFISHPIEGSEEIIHTHYVWLSTRPSIIDARGNQYHAQSRVNNAQCEIQPDNSPQSQVVSHPFIGIEHGMQKPATMQHEVQHLVTSRSASQSPSNGQDRQRFEPPQTSQTKYDPSIVNHTITHDERQTTQGFVPTRAGPLVILENGVSTAAISDSDLATITSVPRSTGHGSVSVPNLVGLSAPVFSSNTLPDASDTMPGAYRNNYKPAMLPYRPGLDTMFPVSMACSSSRYQRLTCYGQPSYATAMKDEFQPFVEAAKLRKPAFWGVMKFTGVSITFATCNSFCSFTLRRLLIFVRPFIHH